jgi:hypothetical protein
MDPNDKRRRSLRLHQLIALAVSLGGVVVALLDFHGWGPSIAGTGLAAAVVLEWVLMGR